MTDPVLLVDLRAAQTYRERGIARYCQSLTIALGATRPDLRVSCLLTKDAEAPIMLADLQRNVDVLYSIPSPSERRITHFLQGALIEGRKTVRQLFPSELIAHAPKLGAIAFDMIPWIYRDQYLADATTAREYLRVLPALARMDRVFALSESVRRDVIAIANADPGRVVALYGGFDAERWPQGALPSDDRPLEVRVAGTAGRAATVRVPYWLYVGGDDWRKNVPRLLEAFAKLKGERYDAGSLVIACSMRAETKAEFETEAKRLGLHPGRDVVLTGLISDADLGQLYSHCLATIFPSLYEGLGLPVVESYAFGKPALASSTSSLGELVPPECGFDPLDVSSIASAMVRFLEEPAIARASLTFGAEVLARCAWPAAARTVGEWVDARPGLSTQAPSQDRLWVVSSLPPDRSGVAYYTQRSLASPVAPVAFFAPSSGPADLEAKREDIARARHLVGRPAARVDVLAIRALGEMRRARPESNALFVLGNSEHHLQTLACLLETGAHDGDAIHLHDVFIGSLLLLHFGSIDRLRSELLRHYSPNDVVAAFDGQGYLENAAVRVAGPRLLAQRADVRHFIVNSEAAADSLREDLGPSAGDIKIDITFLPILPPITPPAGPDSRRRDDELKIGHFGILGPAKQLPTLVAACDQLVARRPVQLVIAGYDVASYLAGRGLDRPYMQVLDSPSDVDLQHAMASVDCAVQLRYPDHGESSGVVNQLLALHRPVVCTNAGSFAALADALYLVPADVTEGALVEAIERAVTEGWRRAATQVVERRSPAAFESRLRALTSKDFVADHRPTWSPT